MPPSIVNLVLVFGLLIGLAAGCCNFSEWGKSNTNSSPSPTPSPSSSESEDSSAIPAVDLFNEYKRDSKAADAKYKDKNLVVRGKIRLVTDKNIVLNSGEKSDILGVQCIMKEGERDRASGLSEGQTITVEGLCFGRIGNVVLRNCTIK